VLRSILTCSKGDSDNKLSISRITRALGTYPFTEIISDIRGNWKTTANLEVEGEDVQSVLKRICHCDIENGAYFNELAYREHVAERMGRGVPFGRDADKFDIGYVEDQHQGKLLFIISPILKEVILDLLMPHPGGY